MAATGTAQLEKVVRKVLDEELGGDSEATLKGIQRVTRLLTDQVIPKLSNGAGEDEGHDSTPERSALRGFSMRGATPTPAKPPGKPVPGKPGKPELPEPPNGELPEGAMEALEDLHGTLGREQAEALAAFFKTIGEGPEEEEDDTEGDTASAYAGSDRRLAKLEASKPDELEAAIDALTPYIAEEEDGALSLAAPKRVVGGLDKGVYATLSEYIEETNQLIRGGAPGAFGARGGSIWWKPLLRMLSVMGKALPWFKYACAAGVVIKNQARYPGSPPDRIWLRAAARNIIQTCL